MLVRCSLAALALTACEFAPDETLSERTFVTANTNVRETIVLHSTLHDPVIERSYELARDGESRSIGGYRDEARDGIATPPFENGNALVVMSGAHVAVIDPIAGALDAATVTWFSPYDVPCFAEHGRLNGHYDVRAAGARIEELDWLFVYEPIEGRTPPSESEPVPVHFVSRDGGRTFAWLQCPRASVPSR